MRDDHAMFRLAASLVRVLRGAALALAIATVAAVGPVAPTPVAYAVEPGEMLKDRALEARARQISAGLRCPVCQNQSIDDSNAPLAKDLRLLVRERLTAGDSDRAVVDYIVNRYGEFVLLKPRLGWHTVLLWLAPLSLLAAAAGYIVWRLRSGAAGTGMASAKVPQTAGLTPEEEARLARLVEERRG